MAQLHHPTSERFPAVAYPKSLGAHNLPVRLTGFVGRASELTQVGELLAENQLVTLTGAGGVARPGWRCFNTYTAGNGRDGDSGSDLVPPLRIALQQPPGCLDSIASSYRQMGGGHGGNTADATVYRRLRNGLATTICGLNAPPRGSSTVIAGSAYRANARSADGL